MSVDAVNRSLSGDRLIFLALHDNDHDEPEPGDLRRIETIIGAIRQMAKMPAGAIHIIVEGLRRAKSDTVTKTGVSLRAVVRQLPEASARTIEVDAYLRRLHELLDRALSLSSGLSQASRGRARGAAPRDQGIHPAGAQRTGSC